LNGLNISVAEREYVTCGLIFFLFSRTEPSQIPTGTQRTPSQFLLGICTSTLAVRSDHIDLLEPCSWVRSLSRHRDSELGVGSSHHYHACRSYFPGWHFNMQPLGAVLAFVAAAVLLMACHLVRLHVSTWDIAILSSGCPLLEV